MTFNYITQLSNAYDYTVECDAVSGSLKTAYAPHSYGADELFNVTSLNRRFRLKFKVDGGALVGLEYDLSVNSLPDGKVIVPEYTDGRLVVDCNKSWFIPKCDFAQFTSETAVYDRSAGIVQFGDAASGGATYRVCRNLFVSLTANGEICAVYVRL